MGGGHDLLVLVDGEGLDAYGLLFAFAAVAGGDPGALGDHAPDDAGTVLRGQGVFDDAGLDDVDAVVRGGDGPHLVEYLAGHDGDVLVLQAETHEGVPGLVAHHDPGARSIQIAQPLDGVALRADGLHVANGIRNPPQQVAVPPGRSSDPR